MKQDFSVLDVEAIITAIQSSLNLSGNGSSVALHEPVLGEIEHQYVSECLDSGFVSSVGQYVTRFENMLAEYTGSKYAVAVVNGTAALQVALKLAGVEPNDEVLVPSLTFIATANAVSYLGASPHFVDSCYETLGVDPLRLRDYLLDVTEVGMSGCFNRKTGRRIKAIVPMHTFGHPVDLDVLQAISEEFGLALVEDAAESLGSFYKGRHTGQWGLVSAVSFNGNKIVTTGGGGAILTNDEATARRARHLTTTAKIPHQWAYEHDDIGFNYRMPNLNAALGCAQLTQLEDFVLKKRQLADKYADAFQGIKGVSFLREPEFARSNYWLNAILLDSEYANYRNDILNLTNQQGLMTRPVWTPLHKMPMYAMCPRMDLTVSEDIEARLINIPSGSKLA